MRVTSSPWHSCIPESDLSCLALFDSPLPRFQNAEYDKPFWENLRPKPEEGVNPFEPLTFGFQAKRDGLGSPDKDFGPTRGGWPAGGKYFKETGSWGAEDGSPPKAKMPGADPKYGWKHRLFTTPSPQANF